MVSLTFQQRVYRLVKKIPKGKVATYGQIAEKVESQSFDELRMTLSKSKGQSRKSKSILARAVGNALHQNIDPSIPCHRVVDRNGKIAPSYGFGGANEQRRRLVAEGVKFKDNMHVDLSKCLWKEKDSILT